VIGRDRFVEIAALGDTPPVRGAVKDKVDLAARFG
jgi:hypothetical protein